MRQIAQRITGRYHLEPLRKDETLAYVSHRLRVAGAQSEIFKRSALRALYRHARGIPRLINVIADRALLAAYTQDRHTVDAKLVSAAAAEVFGVRRHTPWWPFVTATAGTAAVVFGVTNLGESQREPTSTPSSFLTAAPAPIDTPAAAVPLETLAAPVIETPSAPEPPPPPVTLRALLADPQFVIGTDQAVGELLALWDAHYDAALGDACAQAEQQGLRCFYQRRGTLGELRRLNWPAILSLVTEDGVEHPVVMTSLGYDHANLVANGRTFELPLPELSLYWYGDHLLLWRPGDAPATDLAPGDDDPGVLWLRATLAKLAGQPPPSAGSTRYDAGLERRVRAYQESHQLTVDGIVGARTQIAMLAELGMTDTPTLLTEP
jgi:general secretion pathway protein A